MAKKYKLAYRKNDKVVITRGPYMGEKGCIINVYGFFTKYYDVALTKRPGVMLTKRTNKYLTMDKH